MKRHQDRALNKRKHFTESLLTLSKDKSMTIMAGRHGTGSAAKSLHLIQKHKEELGKEKEREGGESRGQRGKEKGQRQEREERKTHV